MITVSHRVHLAMSFFFFFSSCTYTLVSSSLEIHLICTNTETTNAQQVLCLIQDSLGELCFGADTNNVNISNLADQFIAH